MTRPKRNALIDAAAVLAGLGRELEIDLGNVDHDAIGIGNGEGPHVDLAGEVDDQPGLLVVAGEPGLARHRDRIVRAVTGTGIWARGGYRPKHCEAGKNGGSIPQQYRARGSPPLLQPPVLLEPFVLLLRHPMVKRS